MIRLRLNGANGDIPLKMTCFLFIVYCYDCTLIRYIMRHLNMAYSLKIVFAIHKQKYGYDKKLLATLRLLS